MQSIAPQVCCDWTKRSNDEVEQLFVDTFGTTATALPSIEVVTIARCASVFVPDITIQLSATNASWSVYRVHGSDISFYFAVSSVDRNDTIEVLNEVDAQQAEALRIPGFTSRPPSTVEPARRPAYRFADIHVANYRT